MITKSVKSINPYKSLPVRQAGVIQTIYDIVKAHVGELKVESEKGTGTVFTVLLLMKN
jgi:hypothetical protein